MRLATFRIDNGARSTIGAFVEEHYVDLHALSDGALPDNMLAFLDMGEAGFAQAKALLDELGEDVAGKAHVYAAEQIELDAPVPRPGKIIHTACNFDSHLAELTDWQQPEWQSHNWGDFHFEHPDRISGGAILRHSVRVQCGNSRVSPSNWITKSRLALSSARKHFMCLRVMPWTMWRATPYSTICRPVTYRPGSTPTR